MHAKRLVFNTFLNTMSCLTHYAWFFLSCMHWWTYVVLRWRQAGILTAGDGAHDGRLIIPNKHLLTWYQKGPPAPSLRYSTNPVWQGWQKDSQAIHCRVCFILRVQTRQGSCFTSCSPRFQKATFWRHLTENKQSRRRWVLLTLGSWMQQSNSIAHCIRVLQFALKISTRQD